ncbi:hypothetical protein [Streptomyces sp. NPDC058066]|uniref:hypothetical protein n=1 Tax=Streptomyces sp. NPDC058066 TaxID=3346323 RepID=UPI0036E55DA7
MSIVAGLRKRGIGFESLHESLDTTTPSERPVFHVFAALMFRLSRSDPCLK